MLRNANFKKEIWDSETLSSRITSWILNIDIIINNYIHLRGNTF